MMEVRFSTDKIGLLKDFSETIARMQDIDEKIVTNARKRTAITRQIDITDEQMSKIEIQIRQQVQQDKTSEGKPRYPNQESRDAETKLRLGENAAYQELWAKKEELNLEKQDTDTETDSLNRRFGVAKLEAQMMISAYGGN